MGTRGTTNRDLDRLRALAARGVLQSVAAREMGWSETRLRWWVRRLNLPFVTRAYVRKATAWEQS
jgi:hypothetical protein